ncbi:cation:proton antiporter [Streptomyces sp. NBC_01261]|uniref:cation:proton antiporter n=1 Tax=Streptomyces sp. NBC_01261 TaxID=2903802 RepID=UPI002E302130|nr:cation:proton antiporter [Streptomyces sp. NBC_01261]
MSVPATTSATAHLLCALAALLIAAHTVGWIFARLRQPQVIGEILGGVLLGPMALGLAAPDAQRWLLPTRGPVADTLGGLSTLGLLLLVHFTGTDLRRTDGGSERRTVTMVTVTGLALPFAVGLGMAHMADLAGLSGPNGSPATLTLVFGMAIAVTSVPVISRIMLDLGILGSLFARIVLAVAIAEDVVLYTVLAVVLGFAQSDGSGVPVWRLVGDGTAPPAVTYAYYAVVPVVFLAVVCRWGPGLYSRLAAARANPVARRSSPAHRLVFVLVLCSVCCGLGIDPVFGALASGMCVSRANIPVPHGDITPGAASTAATDEQEATDTLRSFALAVFVPLYFARVGLQLDLSHHFDALFFCWFLALACVAKSFSVWLGARLAGERQATAVNLAVVMNARGGPGIVLASVTYAAGVIDQNFFTVLVLLSVITSYVAGQWLGRAVARGLELTDRDAQDPSTAQQLTPDDASHPGHRPTTAPHPKEHQP